eukprot:COSAG01_NODE_132_length_24759_cov_13.862298_26_plen_75_part_00
MIFDGPSLETVVQPAPTCGASLYPTVTARDHLTAMAISKSKEAKYKAQAQAQAQAKAKAEGESGPPSSSSRPQS